MGSIPTLSVKDRNRRRRVGAPWARALAAAAIASVAWGCVPRIHELGYVSDPAALAKIKPGVQTKLEVAQLMGTPSTTAVFGDETWLYITQRQEAYAFFKPEITEQDVIAIAFNKQGIVDSIHNYTLKNGINVQPVSKTTPTYGKQYGLLEQLIGNIGRFNNQKNSGGSSSSGQ